MGAFDTKSKGDDFLSADWNELTAALGDGWPVSAFDYIAFYNTSDSEYQVRNGLDGTIDFNGTNAATVLQAIHDAMATGESLFLMPYAYNLGTAGLTISKQIHVYGGGRPLSGGGTILYSAGAVDVVTVSADRVHLTDLRISGYGGNDPTAGLVITGDHAVIDRVLINGVNANEGVNLQGGNATFFEPRIVNNKIGLQCNAGGHNCRLFGGMIYTGVANGYLIDLEGGQHLQVFGTDFEGLQASTKAIYVNSANSAMQLFGARFESLLTAIEWNAGGYDVIQAIFAGTITNYAVNRPSTSRIISKYLYVTENGGTATVSNGTTETTVTHGCSYTPNAKDIDVHPVETLNNASFWWVDTITSTTFKIKVNADPGQDVDFKWSVRQL